LRFRKRTRAKQHFTLGFRRDATKKDLHSGIKKREEILGFNARAHLRFYSVEPHL
jgi:hypothetical protein